MVRGVQGGEAGLAQHEGQRGSPRQALAGKAGTAANLGGQMTITVMMKTAPMLDTDGGVLVKPLVHQAGLALRLSKVTTLHPPSHPPEPPCPA